jgi:large subunit ribosomal protein L10
MSKALKQMMADDLRANLEAVDDVLVVGLLPMDAGTNPELRHQLRELGGRLRVIHNRTAAHALGDERKDLARFFGGQTAVAFGGEAIPVAKTLVEAAKKKSVEVRGGFVEGEVLDAEGVRILASSPDKPTLRGMLAGAILGTGRGIAVSLNALGEGIARCLQARVDQSEDSSNEE